MSVTVHLDIRKLERLQRDLDRITDRAVAGLAFDGEAYIKQSFGTSPSQPGETPGVDTGKLRNSIRAERERAAQWAISTDTEYAAHLEFGTSRMAPRPFMSPALDYLARTAPEWFAGFLEKSL
jgi:HK97 gp10 family phage protein